MDETTNVLTERNILSEILFRIKENLILVLIIVVMSVSAGFIYVNVKKPTYTASEEINYIAKYEGKEDDVKLSVDIMRSYIDSMADLCASGVMLDRADYYYGVYLQSGETLDQFIENIKAGTYDDGYSPSSIIERKYYKQELDISKRGDLTDVESFLFNVSCTAEEKGQAVAMLRIYVQAIDRESRNYFEGVKTYVYELVNSSSDIAVVKTGSNLKTLLIFAFVGVGLSFVLVILKAMVDRTVKDKGEIEKLTGIAVLAYIEGQEQQEKGKLKGGEEYGKQ